MTGWRYLDASGEQFQSNYLTDDEQDQLSDEILATLDGYEAILAGERGSSAVAAKNPPDQPSQTLLPWRVRWIRPLPLAASLLLMFALPVLALVVVREFLPTPTASESSAESQKERTTTNTHTQTPTQGGSDGPSVEKAVPNVEVFSGNPIATEMLDAVTEAKLREFELAALLPSTEEEYEAWARKEYPHVMGLYDTLTEVDENDPNAVPLWDGVPVNIPEWGDRLYADTPEEERPQGWRALLIYSGEIFKFDWPVRMDAPYCVPTEEGVQQALAIALPHTDYSALYDELYSENDARNLTRFAEDILVPSDREVDMPSGYPATLAHEQLLLASSLSYLAVSAELMRCSVFDEFLRDTSSLIKATLVNRSSECDVSTRMKQVRQLFERRAELLASVHLQGMSRVWTAPARRE